MLSVLQEDPETWTSHIAQSGGHPSNCSHGNHRSSVITVLHIIFECWCVNCCYILICIIYYRHFARQHALNHLANELLQTTTVLYCI